MRKSIELALDAARNDDQERVIKLLTEALAEPVQQEPVACIRWIPKLENVRSEYFEYGWSDGKKLPVGTQLYAAPVDAKAIRALKLVYDNSTSHDWPEDIWNAIVDALYEEHRKTMATAPQLLGG